MEITSVLIIDMTDKKNLIQEYNPYDPSDEEYESWAPLDKDSALEFLDGFEATYIPVGHEYMLVSMEGDQLYDFVSVKREKEYLFDEVSKAKREEYKAASQYSEDLALSDSEE